MSGPVGWYFDQATWLIRPVAAIRKSGDPMEVLFFERKRGGVIAFGKKETVAQKDFYGAPVFVFSQIDGAEEWLLDFCQLTIRPVAEMRSVSHRSKDKKCILVLPHGQRERVTISSDEKQQLIVVHSDAFRKMIHEIETNFAL